MSPSALPPSLPRGLSTGAWDQPEKSGNFSGTRRRGGEVSQPVRSAAPSPTPRCALSITPDFDPELQSQLAGRGLRTGRPRIRRLPSGDKILRLRQLPLQEAWRSIQVSGGGRVTARQLVRNAGSRCLQSPDLLLLIWKTGIIITSYRVNLSIKRGYEREVLSTELST